MDAHEAARLLSAAWRYHKFSKVECVCVPQRIKGVQRKTHSPHASVFASFIVQDAEAIEAVKKRKGRPRKLDVH